MMPSSRRGVLAGGATGVLALTAGCLDFIRGDGPLEFEAALAAPSDDALAETGYEQAAIDGEEFDETVEFGVEREIRASFWFASYTKPASLEDIGAEAFESDDALDADDVEDTDVDDDRLPDGVDEELLEEVDDPESLIEEELEEGDDADLEEELDGEGDADLEEPAGGMPTDAVTDAEHTFVAISTPGIEVAGQSLNPLEGMGSEELIEEFLGEVGEDVEDIEHVGTDAATILGDQREVDRLHGTVSQDGVSTTIEISMATFTHDEDLLVLVGAYLEAAEDEADNVVTLMESVDHPLESP